jgi:EmrB/QacA subfamily drug resistance transporter
LADLSGEFMFFGTRTAVRPRTILALISFSVFLGALDLTVVSTILRQVIFDLEIPFPAGLNEAAWIVTGYLVAYTLTMPFMGRLSDLYGRRRVFLGCVGLFVLGSIVVGVANTLSLMILGRAIQALGAGALVPVSMAIVGDIYPESQRAFALGVIGAVDTAGWVIGPLYGALMVTNWHWRWIFFVNVPLGIAAAGVASVALRGLDRPGEDSKMDYQGAVLLSAALAAVSLALTGSPSGSQSDFAAASTQTGGGLSPYAPILGLVALAAGITFWIRERRASSPLVDLHMFDKPVMVAACAVNLLVGGALIAGVVDVPLFVNTVMLIARNMTPAQADLQSGAILAALTSSMMAAALIGGMLTERWGYRRPAVLGLLVAALGFGLLSRWGLALDNFTQARDLVVCGLGLGLVISPVATAAINAVTEHQRGTASALVLILRLVGMSVALSGLTTWGVYRFDTLTRGVQLGAMTAEFVARVSSQVMDEIFLAAAAVCLIALIPAYFLREQLSPFVRTVRHWW